MPSCPGFLTAVGRREWWTVDQRRGWPGRRRRRVVSYSGGLQRIAAECSGSRWPAAVYGRVAAIPQGQRTVFTLSQKSKKGAYDPAIETPPDLPWFRFNKVLVDAKASAIYHDVTAILNPSARPQDLELARLKDAADVVKQVLFSTAKAVGIVGQQAMGKSFGSEEEIHSHYGLGASGLATMDCCRFWYIAIDYSKVRR